MNPEECQKTARLRSQEEGREQSGVCADWRACHLSRICEPLLRVQICFVVVFLSMKRENVLRWLPWREMGSLLQGLRRLPCRTFPIHRECTGVGGNPGRQTEKRKKKCSVVRMGWRVNQNVTEVPPHVRNALSLDRSVQGQHSAH